MLELRVVDHGRGIPAAFRDKIFERFQQVDSSDARRQNGTGLGLAISKLIIEKHRGWIGVESVEGQGSTFWCRLPRWKGGAEGEASKGVTATEPGAAAA
jgi:signal transduction histidine kinase